MMLNSINDGLNMKECALQSPDAQHELLFDAEKEIDGKTWEKMKQYLMHLHDEGESWGNFRSQASNMKILFPGRAHELPLDEDSYQAVRRQSINEILHQRHIRQISKELLQMQILWPEKMRGFLGADFCEDLQEKMWDALIEDRKENPNRCMIYDVGYAIAALWPDTKERILSETTIWNGVKDTALRHRENKYHMCAYASEAAMIKVLWPERMGQMRLDREAWSLMHWWLGIMRSHEDGGCDLAANMKILSARKVEFGSDGLQCTGVMRPDAMIGIPTLPVSKQFQDLLQA